MAEKPLHKRIWRWIRGDAIWAAISNVFSLVLEHGGKAATVLATSGSLLLVRYREFLERWPSLYLADRIGIVFAVLFLFGSVILFIRLMWLKWHPHGPARETLPHPIIQSRIDAEAPPNASKIPPVTHLLAIQCADLARRYKRLAHDQPALTRQPLSPATFPKDGESWSHAHVELRELRTQYINLVAGSKQLWKEMEWPTENERFFKLDGGIHVIDLVSAIERHYDVLLRKTVLTEAPKPLRPYPEMEIESIDGKIIVRLRNNTGRSADGCSVRLINIHELKGSQFVPPSHFASRLIIPEQTIQPYGDSGAIVFAAIGGAKRQYLSIEDASGKLVPYHVTTPGTWKAILSVREGPDKSHPEAVFFQWSPGDDPEIIATDPSHRS